MKFLTSTWFIVGALLLAVLFSYGSIRSYIRNYNINKEIAALEEKQAALEKERSAISSLLKSIQSEAFAEEQAREQFGLRKPGEKAVVIQRDEEASAKQQREADQKERTNPERWWRYFFSQQKDRG